VIVDAYAKAIMSMMFAKFQPKNMSHDIGSMNKTGDVMG